MINLTETEAEYILDTLIDIAQSTEIDYSPLLEKINTSIQMLDPLVYNDRFYRFERKFDE